MRNLASNKLLDLKVIVTSCQSKIQEIMNFQCKPLREPLKVLVVNPLAPSSKLLIVKIMSGFIFGCDESIDLTLLVYSNEVLFATDFKSELKACAFSCYNSLNIISDLPSITDYDVLCFLTNFSNPNYLDLSKPETDEQFDSLYLIIKLAFNFSWPDKINLEEDYSKIADFHNKTVRKEDLNTNIRKPIIIADGLVAIDILKSISRNLPDDVFFCPTPIPGIAKSILADRLNIQFNLLNDVFVWAANDAVFHVDIEKPLIVEEEMEKKEKSSGEWEAVGRDHLKKLNYNCNQFTPAWMRNELIKKVATSASKNPYGCIYRAATLAQTLKDIWIMRSQRGGMKINSNIGVISDGSLGTIKGYPYVLPILFTGDNWTVNKKFEEDAHLKQEIKRMNKAVKFHHEKLIAYCKKFLQDNVINKLFVPAEDVSDTSY